MLSLILLVPAAALFWGMKDALGRRMAMLLAIVASGVWVVLSTEFLSAFRMLDWMGCLIAWCVGAAVALGVARKLTGGSNADGATPGRGGAAFLILGLAGIVVAMSGVIAVVSPPNNYDSMTYHMARVMHWMQNRSVMHYPTHIARQLYQGPLAEYGVLQLQLLVGSDRLANLVQWTAMIGCAAGVSLIARLLGADVRGQLLSPVLCIAIPMGVLQAVTTQNDYALAFWLVCTCAFVLAAERAETVKRMALFVVAAGAAVGLAILTKGTGYVYAPAFVIWLIAIAIKRWKSRAFVPLIVAGVLGLGLNVPYFVRNAKTFGSPLGPGKEDASGPYADAAYGNGTHSPAAIASNLVKNFALELAMPWPGWNDGLQRIASGIHSALGISPDDVRTNFMEKPFAVPIGAWNNEDGAGSPLSFLLAVAAVGLICLPNRGLDRELVWRRRALAASIATGAILFSGYLRWMPWHCRLHLPLLVLSTPLVAVALEKFGKGIVLQCVATAVAALSFFWLLDNPAHPVVGPVTIFNVPRENQYFFMSPPLRRPIAELAHVGIQYSRIGLDLGRDDWEYPLWVLMKSRNPGVRIECVRVTDEFAAKVAPVPPPFEPEVVLTLKPGVPVRAEVSTSQ